MTLDEGLIWASSLAQQRTMHSYVTDVYPTSIGDVTARVYRPRAIYGTTYTSVIIDEMSESKEVSKTARKVNPSKGLEVLYDILGFTGENAEEIAKIKPLEVAPASKELALHERLDSIIESSSFGTEVDLFWDEVGGVVRLKDLVIPEGTNLESIRAAIQAELRKIDGITDTSILNTLSSSSLVLQAEEDFL